VSGVAGADFLVDGTVLLPAEMVGGRTCRVGARVVIDVERALEGEGSDWKAVKLHFLGQMTRKNRRPQRTRKGARPAVANDSRKQQKTKDGIEVFAHEGCVTSLDGSKCIVDGSIFVPKHLYQSLSLKVPSSPSGRISCAGSFVVLWQFTELEP